MVMSVHLEMGLYDLCRLRIEADTEFQAAAGRRAFDTVDDTLFDEYRLWQLKKTVRLAGEKSAFYRGRFQDAGFSPEDLRTLEDLRRLPFTDSSDLAGSSFPFLCTSQGEVEKPVTFYSSGSTGTRKRIFFSRRDIQKILDFLPRGMNTVIDRKDCRCQVFLQNSQGRGIGQILADSLRAFGMQAWTSDLGDAPEDILQTTLDHHVNVWFGEAITILRASRILSRRMDLSRLGMRCVFITMTNISSSMVKALEDIWKCRVSTHYGLTESGWGLAVDCGVCPGYHYDELNHILEIVDPDTGEVLPYGREGEVVLTNIARDCMPLLRYRTGDIAVLERSICGSHLDVLGHIRRRKEGAYRLGDRELYPALFDEVIFAQPDILDYRIFAQGDQLYFDLEVLEPEAFSPRDMAMRLAALEPLQGLRNPILRALPCGALRPFRFEKKRILPLEAR